MEAGGGLIMKRVSSLAIRLSGFSGEHPSLQKDILSLCPCPSDTFFDQYLSTRSSSSGPPLGLVFWLTVHSSNLHWLCRRRELGSWLRRCRTGWLAPCNAHRQLRLAPWRRSSASSCRYAAGAQFVCLTQLSPRGLSGCTRPLTHCVQERTGNSRKARCSEWYHLATGEPSVLLRL